MPGPERVNGRRIDPTIDCNQCQATAELTTFERLSTGTDEQRNGIAVRELQRRTLCTVSLLNRRLIRRENHRSH